MKKKSLLLLVLYTLFVVSVAILYKIYVLPRYGIGTIDIGIAIVLFGIMGILIASTIKEIKYTSPFELEAKSRKDEDKPVEVVEIPEGHYKGVKVGELLKHAKKGGLKIKGEFDFAIVNGDMTDTSPENIKRGDHIIYIITKGG